MSFGRSDLDRCDIGILRRDLDRDPRGDCDAVFCSHGTLLARKLRSIERRQFGFCRRDVAGGQQAQLAGGLRASQRTVGKKTRFRGQNRWRLLR